MIAFHRVGLEYPRTGTKALYNVSLEVEGRRLHLVVLEDHADPAAVQGHLVPPEVLEVLPGKVHRPLGGKKAAEDKGQQGGLPGPGVAHHSPFFTSRLTL